MSTKKITIIALITAAVLAAGVFSMYDYYNKRLETMRETSVKLLRESVTLTDYGKKDQKKINEILDEGEMQIRSSTQQYEIDQIVVTAQGDISDIKTIKQNRREVRHKLKAIVSLDKYRDKQKKEIKSILKKYRKRINKKTERKQMNKQVRKAKKEINKIKTDAQLTAEEEAARLAELERQRLAAEAAEKARKEKEAEEKKKEKEKKEQKKGSSGKKKKK